MAGTIPEHPHIGQMLNTHIRKNRYYQSALARDIGMSAESVAKFLKRSDNKVSNLWKISHMLNYNFISDIAAQLPSSMPCAATAKDHRISELEKQLEELNAECKTLQRIVDVLNKN
jgi:DNA-binding transcriptional MerR regulator